MTASDAKKTTSAGGKTAAKKDFDKSASKPANSNKPPKPVIAGRVAETERGRLKLNGTRFIITSAQNNTPVHEGFFKALESCARENGAQLLVSQFTYNKGAFENKKTVKEGAKDSFQNLTKEDVDDLWYDERIKPYVMNKRAMIAKGLEFGGEVNILPTAKSPLSGYESYFKNNSGILPHTTHEMKSLPGMKEDGARFLYATGTCTKRNYIQKKAGQTAEAHHTFGALMVEVDDDGKWFVRQLVADEKGAFYDLDKKYMPNGKVLTNQRPEAITWGDIHVEKLDKVVAKAAWGDGGMLDQLRPKYQFMHDLPDFEGRSHHNINDPYHWAKQLFEKRPSVADVMGECAKFLCGAERDFSKVFVVEGNHDRHLLKWLSDTKNIKNDPLNAHFFHACNAKIFDEISKGNKDYPGKIFEFAVKNEALKQKIALRSTTFLTPDTTFKICKGLGGDSAGIECNLHGDLGPNGARATPKSFRYLGSKVNTGHTHTAGIYQGVYTAGVSGQLNMGYNVGPSSWSHSHIITYPNGKRAIVTMNNGKWRALNKPKPRDIIPLNPTSPAVAA